mmetsp:Transcript_66244/g.149553  ORF Transcript_66244/g.149553 Transcript_66244/m.149553 type:complete len:370 (+) Transcript_66244:64-1173(+)|eukprot:CAMPEP_0197895640 /NCGR_PEP_ID=MMETSP1439-20131203/37760_1 /TAXON_ID=66791 /ORGANISM="Gonyaulax spinifera, Strain CCMP409" /LENGTH=369 /DNA_ID=CAMNT_0043516097 /DNA_START=60 /DNA_END=1169 /DNA_ORIENTATION=+
MGIITSKLANLIPSEGDINLFVSGLVRKSHTVRIDWDRPSPSNATLKGLLSASLDKEWDFDTFWDEFLGQTIEALQNLLPDGRMERVSSTDWRIYFKDQPVMVMRAAKDEGLIECRNLKEAWKAVHQIHQKPLRVETWAEWLQVPLYQHPALHLEKLHFMHLALQRIDESIQMGRVGLSDGHSPSNLWLSCMVSDPLEQYGDFDTIWDALVETLKVSNMGLHKSVQQQAKSDGFTLFTKGGGSRSAWSWAKYTYDKNVTESPNAHQLVGPTAHQMSYGEIRGEHYGPWRQLAWRSRIILYRKPLVIEFRGEHLDGPRTRLAEPNPLLYYGLLEIFSKMCDKKYPVSSKGGACGKRKRPEQVDGDGNKDE